MIFTSPSSGTSTNRRASQWSLIGVCLFWSILPISAQAQVAFPKASPKIAEAEAQKAFQAANDSCLTEAYAQCIQKYQQIISEGYVSADLEYNLGTAYLNNHQLGYALLHLERALYLDPNDRDARENWEAAQRLINSASPESKPIELSKSLFHRVALYTTYSRWGLSFLICWVLAGLGFFFRSLIGPPQKRFILLLISISALIVAGACGAVMASHLYVRSLSNAIVVAPATPVLEGPHQHYKTILKITEGHSVRVLERDGQFYKVRLNNGLEGWIPAKDAQEIAP